ncbi:MAG: cytochrome c4 [Gammaproteobacteria bacterium]|nr:cytochrome c4 [Gammaproteobacteria bacterium]
MKRTFILTLGLMVAVSGLARAAADADPFVWSRATLKQIAAGDPAKGEELAGKLKCSKCHGDKGISEDDTSPSIAGQIPAYNYKQLVDYKSGVRDSKDMKKATAKLSPQDMADLVAYFAKLPPEPPLGKAKPPVLVTKGDPERLLLPCAMCHGKKGQGWGFEVPALTGQKGEHFVETMTAFQTGDRANDQYGRMRFIASQLSEQEIAELAAYYGAKPSPKEED